ncbi:MAG: hypothetical protein QOI20_616 [Acidimicrobiaceae bacterium]|nr:hypothetical protein [Acidimicrobiaceae bacterium]
MGVLLLTGCTKSSHNTSPGTVPTDSTLRRSDIAPPKDCNKLDAGALSKSAGQQVTLNMDRSSADLADPKKGFRCAFVAAGNPAEAGSISFVTFASNEAAKAALNEGSQGARSLGLTTSSQARGDGAYAVDQGTSWVCVILHGKALATGTLLTTSADAACAWADEAVKQFA